jgi:flagellin-like hook-associated protein FlgL
MEYEEYLMQVNSFNNNSFLTLENNKKAAENALERISSGKNKQLDDVALALIANSLGSEISGLLKV